MDFVFRDKRGQVAKIGDRVRSGNDFSREWIVISLGGRAPGGGDYNVPRIILSSAKHGDTFRDVVTDSCSPEAFKGFWEIINREVSYANAKDANGRRVIKYVQLYEMPDGMPGRVVGAVKTDKGVMCFLEIGEPHYGAWARCYSHKLTPING